MKTKFLAHIVKHYKVYLWLPVVSMMLLHEYTGKTAGEYGRIAYYINKNSMQLILVHVLWFVLVAVAALIILNLRAG